MRTVAYILLGTGLVVIAGYILFGLYMIFAQKTVPLLLKVGLGAGILGFLVLMLALWLERRREGDEG
ncbi:MAG: Uncharacterized protein XD69_0589 [Clostridia bacterium 62_21]|nr:MAG: Uncharacterized protein XD69_0589 [Clostridia bacterium 62_21]HAG07188.1 hypothetical protein [Peptococcaceae bacterium]